MKDAHGRTVHRFTDLAAERREETRARRARQAFSEAQEWAATATTQELQDALLCLTGLSDAYRLAALRQLRTRRTQPKED